LKIETNSKKIRHCHHIIPIHNVIHQHLFCSKPRQQYDISTRISADKYTYYYIIVLCVELTTNKSAYNSRTTRRQKHNVKSIISTPPLYPKIYARRSSVTTNNTEWRRGSSIQYIYNKSRQFFNVMRNYNIIIAFGSQYLIIIILCSNTRARTITSK